MRIIGIDPGLSGGIAILDDLKIYDIFDMPIMSEGKKNKNQLNSAQLVNIINKHVLKKENTFVIVEQVSAMPGQGVTSMFNFGQTFGSIKGICAALGLPIFYVRPAKWKKHFELINSSKDFVELSILLNNLTLSKINAHEKIELAIRINITALTIKSALKKSFQREKSVAPPNPTA